MPDTVLGDGVYKTEKVPAHLELILGRWLGNRDKINMSATGECLEK